MLKPGSNRKNAFPQKKLPESSFFIIQLFIYLYTIPSRRTVYSFLVAS